ncbi:MAG: SPOR domain-containing protein, partial [Bosea sp. (in: a-proteobacteria)]
MSEPARNRFALDLEDLERQLRGAAQPPKPGQATDPLAELTRIVGQDDPLKDLFAPKAPRAAEPIAPAQVANPSWPEARREPAFGAVTEPAPPAELRGALDEFEALLRRSDNAAPSAKAAAAVYVPPPAPVYDDEPAALAYPRSAAPQPSEAGPRDLDQHPAYGQEQAYAPDGAYPYDYDQTAQGEQELPPDEDLPELRPRRSRKGLWTAVALISVGVMGVGAAMTFRSTTSTSDGKPLVISADAAPTKVEPVNPGGKEIPNQNKQIYERSAQAPKAATTIVTREEQPVDVQQAARSMPARVVLPGPGSEAGSNPLASAPGVPERIAQPAEPALTAVPPVPGLGEPRKVRTVAIRPDGTPAAPANAAPSLVTGSTPAPSASAQGSAATQLAPTPRPRPTVVAEAPKVQDRATPPAPAATTPSAPVRVANAAPAATTPAPAAPATQAIRSGTGDFTVQLGAPGSEAEARATFAALQRKYPDVLGGQAPIIRKTDLAGGKTVYRLRIGPYTRDNATTMCSQLQAAGG